MAKKETNETRFQNGEWFYTLLPPHIPERIEPSKAKLLERGYQIGRRETLSSLAEQVRAIENPYKAKGHYDPTDYDSESAFESCRQAILRDVLGEKE